MSGLSANIEQIIDQLIEKNVRPGSWPTGVLSCLNRRTVDAIVDESRKPLEQLHEALQRQLRALVSSAPVPLRDAVIQAAEAKDSDEVQALRNAYVIGMMSFAQHLTASAMLERASDEMLAEINAAMTNPATRALLDHLSHELDSTTEQLAKTLELTSDEVGVILNDVRRLMLVEFRQVGNDTVFFLTPFGRQLLATASPAAPGQKAVLLSNSGMSLRARLLDGQVFENGETEHEHIAADMDSLKDLLENLGYAVRYE
jgi:hypothetical protein